MKNESVICKTIEQKEYINIRKYIKWLKIDGVNVHPGGEKGMLRTFNQMPLAVCDLVIFILSEYTSSTPMTFNDSIIIHFDTEKISFLISFFVICFYAASGPINDSFLRWNVVIRVHDST